MRNSIIIDLITIRDDSNTITIVLYGCHVCTVEFIDLIHYYCTERMEFHLVSVKSALVDIIIIVMLCLTRF